ncbi:hypothetical protein AVEN_229926-1 [Araneus ventricosus]|uniref:Uncharacterized protein n=1 Tax=Araneus ventricosus TaxID=182803 RepID=A0A4Y2BZC5_ARAVE|nr:hypothetical protein AVEN_229926-1 [Araneus ventricosus]
MEQVRCLHPVWVASSNHRSAGETCVTPTGGNIPLHRVYKPHPWPLLLILLLWSEIALPMITGIGFTMLGALLLLAAMPAITMSTHEGIFSLSNHFSGGEALLSVFQ